MALHDVYARAIRHSKEYREFTLDTGRTAISSEELEAIVKKYKYDFVMNEDDVKELIGQLPGSYKPDAARIEKQRAVSEKLNEESIRAEAEAVSNPISKAVSICSAGMYFDYEDEYFLNCIANYGSDESKQRLTGMAEEIAKANKELVELAEKRDRAQYNYHKGLLSNPDHPSDEVDEALRQYNEALKALNDKKSAFREAYKSIAPVEIRRFASQMDGFVDKLNRASDPEYLLENYKEIRIKTAMFAESAELLKKFKNSFEPRELEILGTQFGRSNALSRKILADANVIAHPIGKYVDVSALKEVDPNALKTILENFSDRIFSRSKELSNAYEQDPEKKKVMRNLTAENSLVENIGSTAKNAFNLWSSSIRNLYGIAKDDILIQTLDGRNMVLDEKNMVQLYKEGRPFFAQPRTVSGEPATLFQPLDGYNLAYGDGILNAQANDPGAAPEEPNAIVRTWDSIISAIGGIFGLDWRVDSVVKYEAELEVYTTRQNLSEGLDHAKQHFDNLQYECMEVDLRRYAAELDAAEAAKKAQEEAERREAERNRMFDKANLTPEQRAKAMSIFKACDFKIRNGVNPNISTEKQFANVVTAFTTQTYLEGELKKAAQLGSLNPGFAELLNSARDGELFVSDEASRLAAEPELKQFLGNMGKEDFDKIVNGKMDSVTAANILKAASDYKTFKVIGKAGEEKSLEKEIAAENKIDENVIANN